MFIVYKFECYLYSLSMYFPEELLNHKIMKTIAAASLVYVCLPKTRNLFNEVRLGLIASGIL